MASNRSAFSNATYETIISFVAALLIFPLVIKIVLGVLKSVLRLGVVRKLLFESALIGVTTLLTKPEVLDKVFGPKPGAER